MKLGVIIGRFQVDSLHIGHTKLLSKAIKDCDQVVVLVGRSLAGQPTHKDPLNFEDIKHMLLVYHESLTVLSLPDVPGDDTAWSNLVDQCVMLACPGAMDVTLYGGRDSFIPYYKGQFDTEEVGEVPNVSATDIREGLKDLLLSTAAHRSGAIKAIMNRFPTCYPCVDIAVTDIAKERIILGRKKGECLWRLPGGFVDPGESFEYAAMREFAEEAQVQVNNLKYLGSYVINDSRYSKGPDSITTALFLGITGDGAIPKAGDDLEEAKWFSLEELKQMDGYGVDGLITPSHKQLLNKVLRCI